MKKNIVQSTLLFSFAAFTIAACGTPPAKQLPAAKHGAPATATAAAKQSTPPVKIAPDSPLSQLQGVWVGECIQSEPVEGTTSDGKAIDNKPAHQRKYSFKGNQVAIRDGFFKDDKCEEKDTSQKIPDAIYVASDAKAGDVAGKINITGASADNFADQPDDKTGAKLDLTVLLSGGLDSFTVGDEKFIKKVVDPKTATHAKSSTVADLKAKNDATAKAADAAAAAAKKAKTDQAAADQAKK